MSDAFRLKIQCAPDRLRSRALACVSGQMQTVFCTIRIDITKKFGSGLLLVTANSEASHATILIADRQLGYVLCFQWSELTYCIENPKQRGAEVMMATLASDLQAFKNRVEILLAPQAHANGNVNLGMQDIFRFELFHQTIGNEFVICRRLQILGECFEGHQKLLEI